MDTTPPPIDGRATDHTRTGAVWVTATGAFLVFAAAAVFVALRWDAIPNEAKLGVLGGLTGGLLATGRSLRRSLPATAGVLFHLGAFLIPVNLAAISIHLGWGWEELLLVEGAVGSVVYGILHRTERSKPLGWAAVVSAIVAAGGMAAVLEAPAPLLLAGIAVVASIVGAPRAATTWAMVAGAAPLIALAAGLASFTAVPEAVRALGLAGPDPQRSAIAVGVLTAGVLIRRAHQTRDLTFAVAGLVTGATGVATTWVALAPQTRPSWAGVGALFLSVELIAALLRRDVFWSRVSGPIADVAEVAIGAATLLAVPALITYDVTADWTGGTTLTDHRLLIAAVLATVGWFLADLRRIEPDRTPAGIALLVGGGFAPSTVLIALTLGAATLISTGSLTATGITVAIVGMALVATGRPLAHATALGCAIAAPVLAAADPAVALLLGGAGSVTVTGAVILRARLGAELHVAEAWMLDVASLLPAASGLVIALTGSVEAPVAIGATAAVLWALALVTDGAAKSDAMRPLGLVPRVGAALTLLGAGALTPHEIAALAGALTVGFVADALRRDVPGLAFGAAVTGPIAVIATTTAAGGDPTAAGVALCAATLVPAAIAVWCPDRWLPAVVAGGSALALPGLALAAGAQGTLGAALLLVGGTSVTLGVARARTELWVIGGLAATIGIWLRLDAVGVTALDAWVAPVAALLLAGGIAGRREAISSWVSVAPAVALLGGAALVERLAGGHGLHALVAGAVGIAAVLAGGGRRWIGPLLTGTAILVVLTAYESLAMTREVPTPAWLALGGTVLIAAGIAMERHDTGPLETGRRLVDIVHERFS